MRGVPAGFADCVTAVPPDPPLDVGTARLQHDGYVAALESGGFSVESVPVDDDQPDSSFVEDAAVVIGERGLVTRPGHESRRGEVGPVAVALARHLQLDRVGEPAVIDGGDVLRIGDRIFVGLSGRTNRAGVDAVAAVAESQGITVVAVPVRETLHLKSGVSAIGDDAVLWHPAACESGVFDSLAVIEVPGDDPEAANVVRLADGRILVADHHLATVDLLADRGIDVVATDVSEFARAEGGLTCLSIRLRWE
ncbi:MAG: arginine deiminase family protein [Acidimicrobiia bacterium]